MDTGTIVYVDYDLFNADNDELIETTREETAKKHDQHEENRTYEPLCATVGEGNFIEGFEESLAEAEAEKDYEVDIPPEKAYGERDTNAVEMLGPQQLARQVRDPDNLEVGGPVEIGGRKGTLVMFRAGRARIDFNHALAGKTLRYNYRITKVVEDRIEQVETLLKMLTGSDDFEVEFDGDDVTITIPEYLGYDQSWGMAKFQLLRSLRDSVGVQTITFRDVHPVREVGELEDDGHDHEGHDHDGHEHGEEE
jgi:FKBP-type peptidyl-prolyl cis-trans isomerase 2